MARSFDWPPSSALGSVLKAQQTVEPLGPNRGRRRVYDLSVPFQRDMPSYYFYKNYFQPPMFTVFSQPEGTLLGEGTQELYATHVSFLSHTGTHVDAPIHARPDGHFLHEVPADHWLGEGPVLSVKKGEMEDILVADLEPYRSMVEPGDFVIINTGWHHYWTGPGADREGAIRYMERAPGLCRESSQWLVDRGVATVLVDTPAIDSCSHMGYGDGSLESHKTLFAHNIPGIESVGGELDAVTGHRCLISCAPVKYVNGDAFPLRVLAIPID